MSGIDPQDIVCLVLCAGRGTRLRPLTFKRPKQLLPVCNVPVIDHVLSAVQAAGLHHVGMVVSPEAQDLRSHIRDGRRWDLEIEWVVQKEPKGIGHAVMAAESFVDDRPFIVYLGDGLYSDGIASFVSRFVEVFPSSLLRLTPVDDPRHFGVAQVENGIVKEVIEKPVHPRSNLAITGLYAFPVEFFGTLHQTEPSARGELEITDAIANFLGNPWGVRADIWHGTWTDAGRPGLMLEANRVMLDQYKPMHSQATVRDSIIRGKVGLGAGTIIEGSRIEGPVLVGSDCRVTGSQIGPHVSVADGALIEGARVRRAIIDTDATIYSQQGPLELADSIVGQRATVEGCTCDGQSVSIVVGDDMRVQIS